MMPTQLIKKTTQETLRAAREGSKIFLLCFQCVGSKQFRVVLLYNGKIVLIEANLYYYFLGSTNPGYTRA